MSVLANIWNTAWPIIVAVLSFLVMIAIHEFGHFSVAKLTGVRVNEYSIGFGPAIFKKKRGETLYALRAIPFGGFCSMEGEDEESGDPRAFCNAKAWKRLLIILAGAVFNIILGLLIVMIILSSQKVFVSTTVAEFDENTVSSQYGLKENDKIISVNGRRIYTAYDLSYQFSNVKDGTLDMTVLRDGKKTELSSVKFDTEKIEGISYIKIDFKFYGIRKAFGSFISQSFKTTLSYELTVWRSLVDLISGKYGISAVSGPVGVTAAMSSAAKAGLKRLLPILALITVNLGIFNLLPIPALDGGRALFILIEMIIGKPVPQKYESAVHTVGFVLIMAFAVFVSIKDIIALF